MATEMNVGRTERIGSTAAGLAVLAWVLARPTAARLAFGLVGAALLGRGVTGTCLLYRSLGIGAPAQAVENEASDAAESDAVDSASEDSFPASDPPSWTPVAGSRAVH